jgi:hypothetical protein
LGESRPAGSRSAHFGVVFSTQRGNTNSGQHGANGA